jgi:hypothetical protein
MQMPNKHYSLLLGMILLHFTAMYILMYAMVNTVDNIYPSFNQFYMAGLMTTPMVIMEIVLMKSMYPNKRYNILIGIASLILFIGFFVFIRQQTIIGDKEFIKSMIPHHSGAILMCEEADLNDFELKELCDEIIASQQDEINQMEEILERLE